MNSVSDQLAANNSLLVFVITQNSGYQPASTDFADTWVSQQIAADSPSIRVGDAETQPVASAFLNSALRQTNGIGLVVSRRGMTIVGSVNEYASMESVIDLTVQAKEMAAED